MIQNCTKIGSCCPRCLPNNVTAFMFIGYSKSHASASLLLYWETECGSRQIFTEKDSMWDRLPLLVANISQTWLNKCIWDEGDNCINSFFFSLQVISLELEVTPWNFFNLLIKKPLFSFILYFLLIDMVFSSQIEEEISAVSKAHDSSLWRL